jgi:hypothetical protein
METKPSLNFNRIAQRHIPKRVSLYVLNKKNEIWVKSIQAAKRMGRTTGIGEMMYIRF